MHREIQQPLRDLLLTEGGAPASSDELERRVVGGIRRCVDLRHPTNSSGGGGGGGGGGRSGDDEYGRLPPLAGWPRHSEYS